MQFPTSLLCHPNVRIIINCLARVWRLTITRLLFSSVLSPANSINGKQAISSQMQSTYKTTFTFRWKWSYRLCLFERALTHSMNAQTFRHALLAVFSFYFIFLTVSWKRKSTWWGCELWRMERKNCGKFWSDQIN